MRITNSMSIGNMLRSLRYSNERMNKLQEEMSTGRRLNRPSDDPVGISRSLKFSRDLVENVQFTKNIQDATAFLDTTDSALDSIGNIIHRVKELAVMGANDTLPQQSRDALAQEVNELIGQVIQVGNTAQGGRYIFAGCQNDKGPFKLVTGSPDYIQYSGDGFEPPDTGVLPILDGKIRYEIAPGITDSINCTGIEVFGQFTPSVTLPQPLPPAGTATDNNIFNHLIMLRDALYTSNQTNIQSSMNNLDNDIDKLLNIRSLVGAKTNKMELALNRLETTATNINQQIADNDDADMAEIIMKVKLEENVYRSALSVGARIIPPSLVDFLN